MACPYTGALPLQGAPDAWMEPIRALEKRVRELEAEMKPGAGSGSDWRTDKQSFKQWLTVAMQAPDSAEYKELYGFLAECFLDADSDRDGLVNASEFDLLIERAAALPRRFGLAPSWNEQYGDVENRQKGRREMFVKMDADGSGTIGLEEWLGFAFPHIAEKVKTMSSHTVDFLHLEVEGKDAFLSFLRKACTDKKSMEYKEFYKFLFDSFTKADVDQKGAISLEQFDRLVERSAAAPRSLGLAPKSEEMFKDDAERLASRQTLFNSMDADGGGTITFDEYLNYTVKHIAGKVGAVVADK